MYQTRGICHNAPDALTSVSVSPIIQWLVKALIDGVIPAAPGAPLIFTGSGLGLLPLFVQLIIPSELTLGIKVNPRAT